MMDWYGENMSGWGYFLMTASLLAERLARGEIGEDEYGSRIAALRGHVRS